MPTLDQPLAACADALVATGLLGLSQMHAVIRHAAGFPALERNRLFLEFRLADEIVFEGYGPGFDRHALPDLIASEVDFPAASRVAQALATDPFAEDRLRYLDLMADTDPDWIEFDYSSKGLSDEPGVFFGFPARYRNAYLADLSKLEEALGRLVPQPIADGAVGFWSLIRALLAAEGPAGRDIELYRIGLCEARAPGWVRIVMGGFSGAAFATVCARLFPSFGADRLAEIVTDVEAAGASLPNGVIPSVAIVYGAVEAIDVEMPFFHDIADPASKRERVRAFTRRLVARGLVSGRIAEALASHASTEWTCADGRTRARLVLDHFKFGVGGATSGRVKVYFELVIK